jgi:hypothetical protein
MLKALEGDPEWQELLLTQGRRIRKDSGQMMITRGYLGLIHTIDSILEPLVRENALRPGISAQALRSALISMVEGMLRDQLLARRVGFPATFQVQEIREVFGLVMDALLQSRVEIPSL